jgi:hypothetical protein
VRARLRQARAHAEFEAVRVLQCVLRSHAARALLLESRQAVNSIASAVRGRKARRELRERKPGRGHCRAPAMREADWPPTRSWRVVKPHQMRQLGLADGKLPSKSLSPRKQRLLDRQQARPPPPPLPAEGAFASCA